MPSGRSSLGWSLAALLLGCLAGSAANAHELTGFAAVDLRYFPYSAQFSNQASVNPSLVFQPEYYHRWNEDRDEFSFTPFLRLDPDDDRRTHGDVRELNWLHVGDDWEWLIGIDQVFWGVTESRHFVAIINQTDVIEDTDAEDKFGQPMVRLSLLREWGTLSLFALTGFRKQIPTGERGRLRFRIPVRSEPEYESSREEWRVDWALRWSHSLGDWDVGLAHFSGTSREPRYVPRVAAGGGLETIAFYDTINQSSLDVQATLENWLWKLEAIRRVGHGNRFYALTGGFEYSFYGVFGTAADLGFLVEYLWDGRGSRAPPTSLEHDVFAGVRLTLNDVQASEMLVGIVVDHSNGTRSISLEASRRLGDRWKLELDVRGYSHVADDDLLFSFRRDAHVQVRLARYF